MSSILVTGAAGFIGSNLVRTLLEIGHEVNGLDNFENGKKQNIENELNNDSFRFIEGDICDKKDVKKAVSDVDFVLHQAAFVSVPRSIADPVKTTRTNCYGTANLLKTSVESNVEKIVVASSAAVYGSEIKIPQTEDDKVNPESPYALSKYWTEQLAVQFNEFYDVETLALRYFNVYGPRQDPEGEYSAVIPKFINTMLQWEKPVIFGDGEQSRDFVFVDDVVQANIKALESSCSGEVINIGTNTSTSINRLVEHLNGLLDTSLEPVHRKPRPGDIKHSKADILKASQEIGYNPKTSLEKGLEKTVKYFKNQD